MNKSTNSFSEVWIETVLNYALNKSDVIDLINEFGTIPTEKNWEQNSTQKDLAIILQLDIRDVELKTTLCEILRKKYPAKLPFEAAEKIYKTLIESEDTDTIKIYSEVSDNEKIKSLVRDNPGGFLENEEIIGFLLDDLYTKDVVDFAQKLKEYNIEIYI